MGFLDSLNGSFNNKQQQVDTQQMQGLAQLLAQLQAGKVGGAQDYQRMMEAYNPKPQRQDVMGDLGDSLVQSAKANPQSNNFATIGDALSGLRGNQRKLL